MLQVSRSFIRSLTGVTPAPYLFANAIECCNAELTALQIAQTRQAIGPKSRRVLCVATSGETPLAICSNPTVGQVIACDVSPAQIHLSELRRYALINFNTEQNRTLFGVAESDEALEQKKQERLSLFECLAVKLPEDTRKFWTRLSHSALTVGIMYTGKYEVFYSKIRQRLLENGFKDLVSKFHEYMEDPKFLDTISSELAWENFHKAMQFDQLIEPRLLQRFSMVYDPSTFTDGLKALHAEKADVKSNFFFTLAFQGIHALSSGEAGFPLVLQQEGQKVLLEHGIGEDRLKFLPRDVFEAIKEERKLNLISISNSLDLIPEQEVLQCLKYVFQATAPSGILIIRKAFPHKLRGILEHVGFTVDEEMTEKIRREERSLFLGHYGRQDCILAAQRPQSLDKE